MRVLLVEDDCDIAANISDYLAAAGHVVDLAFDGADGLRAARERRHDLYLLDANLPAIGGFELCAMFRQMLGIDAPVLFTTARGELADRLAGFEAGAWDYLVKPFSLAELGARIEATRLRAGASRRFAIANLSFDVTDRALQVADDRHVLSRIPALVLGQLCQAYPHAVPRGRLISEIWGEEEPDSAPLRSHISALRRRLRRSGADVAIRHTPDLGYALVEDPGA